MSLFKPRAAESRAITSLPWMPTVNNSSGEIVTQQSAVQIPAVWRAASLIAEVLSSLPIDVYRGTGANRVEVSAPPVIMSPSLRLSRREWVYQYAVGMALQGNAFGLITAVDDSGRPLGAEWVDQSAVQVVVEDGLSIPRYFISGREFPRDRIIHLRNFTMPGAVVGLSPVEVHAQTLGINLAARKFAAQWFGGGGHPSAILSTDMRLEPEQADQIRQRFSASQSQRRGLAVLGSGIKYQQVQLAPGESQFLETLHASVSDVARIFGVPAEMLGAAAEGGKSVTYVNREQRQLDFVATCLGHYACRLEEAMTAMTARGLYVKFNFDAFLRGDTLSRFQVHEIALRNHIETLDEVRAIEDLPPLGNGEVFPPAGSATASPAAPAAA